MKILSLFKGRKDAAGSKKLAAFFLLAFICINQSCSKTNSEMMDFIPFSADSNLYLLCENNQIQKLSASENAQFIQRGVSKSEKNGLFLAWEQKSQKLLHINFKGKVVSSVNAVGASAFLNEKYIFLQSNAWDENRGFEFTLYTINYSKLGNKLKLKKIWHGFLDCFVSDYIFFEGGICIAGGTKDNSKHNVYCINTKGISKCFTMEKKSDFLRLVKNPVDSEQVFAFVSQREKINVQPEIYCIDTYGSSNADTAKKIILESDNLSDFECFFGYGFTYDKNLILPCSFNKIIKFVNYDIQSGKIVSIADDVTGCNFPLFLNDGKFYYIAKDPLNLDTTYGISYYDGKKSTSVYQF